MSEHSSFIILRSDKKNIKTISDEEVLKAYKYSGINISDDKEIFNKKIDIKDIFPYIENGRLTYINHFKKVEYIKILDIEFNSLFNTLRDEFNMNAYNAAQNTIEITSIEARYMLEAINYLLLEKYDRNIEENVLNNNYIKVFGSTFTPYYNYYISLTQNNKKDDEDNTELFSYDEEYRSDRFILNRVKVILETFLLLYDEGNWNDLEYILIYTVY